MKLFHSEIFVSFNEFLSTLFSVFFSIGATSNGKSSGFVGLGLIFSFLINASLLFNISISKFEIFLPPGSFGLDIMFYYLVLKLLIYHYQFLEKISLEQIDQLQKKFQT